LAGYSQGALAIHETLRLISPESSLAKKIIGVALLADPGRVAAAMEETYETAASTPFINARHGIWIPIMLGNAATTGPLPDWALSKTVAMCHPNDIVCSNGWWASLDAHTNYSTVEMTFLARKLAGLTGAFF
jgi:hypothetical protein